MSNMINVCNLKLSLKSNIKLFYRYICKNIRDPNRLLFRNFIYEEFNINNEKDDEKISKWNNLFKNYLKMKYHIDEENKLLASYNINVVRDNKSEIKNVARRVGFDV
jgi:hypothetical protein